MKELNKLKFAAAVVVLGALIGCSGGDTKSADAKSTTDTSTTTPAPAGDDLAKGRPEPTAEGVKAEGDTIKLGIVASVSGDNKAWGDDSYVGAKMAVDEANKAGGINGKQISLEMQDSASTTQGAKTAAEKLLSDGVIGILGEVSSGNTIQIANSAFEKSVPVVAIGATKVELTDIGANVFRVCYSDGFQGPVMAKFAYDDLGLRNVALMTDNKLPYSQGLSKTFQEEFEKLGGKIVIEQKYESGQTQFSGQLTELKAKNPDGIFCSGYFTEVGPIAQQARAAGIDKKVVLLGGDGWDSPKLLDSGGDAIVGGYFCNHYNNKENRPEVLQFLTKWKAANGGKDPDTTMAALGYDAAALTIDALKRAKSLDSKSLMTAIDETENFPGVSGKITLKGQKGTPFKQALVVEVKSAKDGFQVFKKAFTPDQIK
jgi:branched-chain amino acid transport system substrate-binding protein